MRASTIVMDLSAMPIKKQFSNQMNPTFVVHVGSKNLIWHSQLATFRSFFKDCIPVNGMNKLQIHHILNDTSGDFFKSANLALHYCRKHPESHFSGVFSLRCELGEPVGVLFTARISDLDDVENGCLYISLVALGSHFAASPKYHRVVNHSTVQTRDVIALLTSRELDVLRMISQGATTKEIATSLYISTHTVDTHKQKLYTKLGVRNTAELGKMAERYGLSDQEE